MKNMITVTDKNIKQIFGRVRKFFISEKYGFKSWHNFSNLMKGRKIKSYMNILPEIYPQIEDVDIDTNIENDKFIRVRIDYENGFLIKIGDKLKFESGRMIHMRNWWAPSDAGKYLYTIYQAHHLSEQELDEYNMKKEYDLSFGLLEDDVDGYWADEIYDDLNSFEQNPYDKMMSNLSDHRMNEDYEPNLVIDSIITNKLIKGELSTGKSPHQPKIHIDAENNTNF